MVQCGVPDLHAGKDGGSGTIHYNVLYTLHYAILYMYSIHYTILYSTLYVPARYTILYSIRPEISPPPLSETER